MRTPSIDLAHRLDLLITPRLLGRQSMRKKCHPVGVEIELRLRKPLVACAKPRKSELAVGPGMRRGYAFQFPTTPVRAIKKWADRLFAFQYASGGRSSLSSGVPE